MVGDIKMSLKHYLIEWIDPEFYEKGKTYDLCKKDKQDLDNKLFDTANKLKLANSKIKSLEKPSEVMKPKFLYGKPYIKPRRRFVSKIHDYEVEFKDPCDVFDKSVMLTRLMKKKKLINIEQSIYGMQRVHNFVKKTYKQYQLDKSENWRPVTETLLGEKGDCEDISLVLVSAFGLAGWKADSVFVATGHYYNRPDSDPIGHAYTVVKTEGRWYVIEGTNAGSRPVEWKRVKTQYLGNWGLMNWKFSGKISRGRTYL